MRGTLKFAQRGRSMAMMVAILVGGAANLGGCSWLHFGSQDEPYDYRKSKPSQEPLEVPPDLSQLPKDDRFSVPSNASAAKPASATATKPAEASAAAVPPETASPAAATPTQVVVPTVARARIMREGEQRWLAVDGSPELAYATVKDLWASMGFKIAVDDPQLGLVETDWSEVRPLIDEDAIRNALHRVLGAFDSTGERNKYRARIERTAKNTAEVTITERRMEEVFVEPLRDTTKWQAVPPDPQLEAQMLQRLALRFAPTQPLQVAVASASNTAVPAAPTGGADAPASSTASTPAATATEARVHKVTVGGIVTLQVEDTQDHTWRKVGVALDRGGFTIEDRNRDKSMYTVRYLDPDYEASEREKRGWWDRLFNADAKVPEQQFRIVVSANGPTTAVEIQDREGKPDSGATAKRILDQLVEQLR